MISKALLGFLVPGKQPSMTAHYKASAPSFFCTAKMCTMAQKHGCDAGRHCRCWTALSSPARKGAHCSQQCATGPQFALSRPYAALHAQPEFSTSKRPSSAGCVCKWPYPHRGSNPRQCCPPAHPCCCAIVRKLTVHKQQWANALKYLFRGHK